LVGIGWSGAHPAAATSSAAGHTERAAPAPAAVDASAVAADTAAPDRVVVEAPAKAECALSFEQRVDEVAALAHRTSDFARQDEIEAAKSSDAEVRLRFAALMRDFEDAGERGLAMLAAIHDPAAKPMDVQPMDAARRAVLRLALTADLARRREAALRTNDMTRVDALVQAVLDIMPSTTITTEDGEHALVDQPYLRAVHEPAVLNIVRLAGTDQFPRATATKLLLTLWHNLQRSGERSSDELSRLALLLLADSDPSQRTVACRQLLMDVRYRHVVIAWLRQSGELGTANEIASLAARDLPPTDALAVLRELGPILPRAPNAYLTLGFRAPEVLADAYRELLASNIQPSVRTDLLAGVGMTRTQIARDLAQLALDNDPAPDVRVQAVFTMSVSGDAAATEKAMHQVLDDPLIAQDPQRLGALVLALQNLEARDDINTLDRLGQRFRSLHLPEASRQILDGMLQRAVPGNAGQSRRHDAGR
jgi:hypothetical protein